MFAHKCMNQLASTFTYINGKGKIHVSFICHVRCTELWIERYKNNLYTVWLSGNIILEGFMTFNWMRKNVIVHFYIWCTVAVRNKYVLTSVSNVSRINIESWTTYWDLLSKWYLWHVIQVLHTVAHDSSVLKHEKLLHMMLMQYITV